MRARFLTAALLVAVGAVSTGCARKPQEPLVGVYLALTGDMADFGITTRQGIELAAEEINAAGGINGQRLRLLVEDDRGKPEEARTVVTKLIDQQGVVAVLGEVASKNSLAAAPICQARGIPMLSPSSTNEEVTRKGDFIFRVCFVDSFQGYVMARFASENLKARTAAVLWDNGSDYSKGLSSVFKSDFQKMGGRIVADVTYAAGDVDFSSQLTRIRAAQPDVIYVPGYYTEVALIGRKARELGITVPLLGGDGWDSENLLKRAGAALDGCYFSSHYSSDTGSPVVERFVRSFQERYSTMPNALAALGYDATWILAEAMKRAGSLEPRKIRDALAATRDYPGVTGQITINEERNAVKPAVVLQVKNGAFRYVTTIQPPDRN